MKSAGKERTPKRQHRQIHALVCAHVSGEFQPRRAEAACTGARLSVSLVPCTSKLEAGDLLSLLEQGADGILVVDCQPPSCRFQVGSARAACSIFDIQSRDRLLSYDDVQRTAKAKERRR